MSQDYYDILGISKSASQDEIKAAFRRLAMEHHPDRGGDSEKFKRINEAYQTLGNQETRQQYDQYGSTFEQMRSRGGATGFEGFRDWASFMNAFSGQGGRKFTGSFNFGDLSDLFGGLGDLGDIFGFTSDRRAGKKAKRGRDLEIAIELSFEESVKGATREIEIDKIGLCRYCEGSGAEPGSKMLSCTTCGGRGQVAQMTRSFFGSIQTVTVCPVCGGEGSKAEKSCNHCRGKGTARVQKRLTVKIPAGITDNGTIRLSGEGEAGGRGGQPGDLYINVRVKSSKQFERRENDIWSKVFLDFKLAALGGKTEVETVDGPIELKIPPGTQSGQVFKLKDKGVPFLRGNGRGDHLIEVVIKVPERLTKKQKEILEEWE